MAIFAACAITALALPAQTLTTLHSFTGPDGSFPSAGLVQATNGYVYGTTLSGGANCAPSGCGTVFKISPTGTLTTLYSFCAQSGCADGAYPQAGLIQATDGNLYGTTSSGGAYCAPYGCGTIFRISLSGTLKTLYSFCPETGCPDGDYPLAGLYQATNGKLYGTTFQGGAYCGSYDVCGTIFEITPAGAFTTVHSFCAQANCTDGSGPMAGLVQSTSGYLYGTTVGGGAHAYGSVFKTTLSGSLTTVHSFCSEGTHPDCTDGYAPEAVLAQASNGGLYGTTLYGGANYTCGAINNPGCGTVFEITPAGKLTTVYNFGAKAGETDGNYPLVGLIQATDGSFYGEASGGGAYSEGSVFKLSPSGTLTTLYNFCHQSGCLDGQNPYAGLIQNTNGDFYGTMYWGGASFEGMVFRLSAGLGPFVEARPASGKVGAAVKILGTNLTGATSVTFNGTAASFQVVSASEITATVPGGATTGKIQVTTPGGTLTSNVTFRVP